MGIAQYNRGTAVIQRDCASNDRSAEFLMMDSLNSVPKKSGASRPFGPIHFVHDKNRGGFWAECPVSGFGYYYRTLREAVSEWLVSINECRNGTFIGQPNAR